MRLWIVLYLLPHVGMAQLVSFGVIGGAPISPDSQNGPRPLECGEPSFAPICGNNYLGAKPYAVGPSVEVFLPFKFSVEADLLYRRFHKDESTGLTLPPGECCRTLLSPTWAGTRFGL